MPRFHPASAAHSLLLIRSRISVFDVRLSIGVRNWGMLAYHEARPVRGRGESLQRVFWRGRACWARLLRCGAVVEVRNDLWTWVWCLVFFLSPKGMQVRQLHMEKRFWWFNISTLLRYHRRWTYEMKSFLMLPPKPAIAWLPNGFAEEYRKYKSAKGGVRKPWTFKNTKRLMV